ncbi:ABC transporter permease [Moraxella bovoculi]|uniref:ABC transporter permease n=1 Tax=Moraxella bovoculi TaxID=386891 RepID=A0AAC8PUM5_9GAMM|nr:iron ABC transporter permease [Moraxella bovoculi]AKG07290.1 ABC transporter permease [Moraxella bovoculi]AKG10104.1 ABC transporter permease [Moraxella bovoculi]AKG12026.1 ABC transporter permease [Moraxella bovoculi]AKG13994.1 ABC transporter permease [Moraxella bovoculi]
MTNSTLIARLWLGLCSLLVIIPLGVILSSLGEFDTEIWQFLLDYELGHLLKNTLWLALSVGIGVTVLGTSTAWLTAMYHFPLKRLFSWAMMLPLAVPAYVLAFVQLGIFDYTGVISTYLREAWGLNNGLPNIRHGGGLALVMSLTLYPYVYLLSKNAFSSMGNRALEVGASLGLSNRQSFFKIALPMARPWIASGIILALMEVLADFGAVSIFGYDTFTTAIYQAWYGFFSIETAKQLASLLVGLVFIFLVLEQLSRGRKSFESTGRSSYHRIIDLHGIKKWLAFSYCASILFLAFLLPIIQLSLWVIETWQGIDFIAVVEQTKNSIIASLSAAALVSIFAFFISLSIRHDTSKFTLISARIATLGYAIPGSVLAVGVFIPVAFLDNYLIEYIPAFAEHDAIFKGTVIILLIAYLIRFLALGVQTMDSGMKRIKSTHIEAAKSLGATPLSSLFKVHLPLIKSSLGVTLLMVFVDTMKEMPITLMMRPFDWDTLAIRIYSFTSEGMYEQAALPALTIVLTGLIPVILFVKIDQKS